jgi:ElaB/YqjD/DUF883 family membrane-anchored ribosome-binding protein
LEKKMAQAQTQSGMKNGTASKLNKVQDNFEQKGSEFMGEAREAVTEFVENGSEAVRGWISDAGEYISDAEGTVRNSIKKHPLQAILIGLGVGCAAGILWNLSRNRA